MQSRIEQLEDEANERLTELAIAKEAGVASGARVEVRGAVFSASDVSVSTLFLRLRIGSAVSLCPCLRKRVPH